MPNRNLAVHLVLLLCLPLVNVLVALGQTTTVTYQGKLAEAGQSANGTFDLQFKLFDAVSGGVQQGATATLEDVVVANGVFTVQLDFGAAAFPGAARFLEIGVRPGASTGAFTLLTPRQAVQSTPYAIRSLSAGQADNATNATNATTAQNALQLGGVVANQYVLTNDARLTDARTPLPGSGSYIQNTVTQQGTSNFNISGSGVAAGTLSGNVVHAVTQFNLGDNRVLSNAGLDNLFAGTGAGAANTGGVFNSFFGANAGAANTNGFNNSFFGKNAGAVNGVSNNSFFGAEAGAANTTGSGNAFFGAEAGAANQSGSSNAFFGKSTGTANTSGSNNAFFGPSAGQTNSIGSQNSFFGQLAGAATTTGLNNSFFGQRAGAVNVNGGSNAFFGREAGVANTSGSSNAFFGLNAGNTNTTGGNNTALGANSDVAAGALDHATALGADAVVSTSNTIVLGRSAGQDAVNVPGAMTVTGALTANGTGLANLNAANIATGTLAVARGGTGLSAAGATGNYLRSDGTNWASSAFQAADLPGGSASYIQNTAVQQTASNFNVSGNGTAGGTLSANIVNATTQFNLNGGRVLASTGTANLFAGIGAGAANTGNNNAFFGSAAGDVNTTGSNNAFFGTNAGGANTTGARNTFLGQGSGSLTSTGTDNTFIGNTAGDANTIGSNNAALGNGADVSTSNLAFATAIGAGASVTASNRIQLGRDGTDTVSIGTLTSASATHVCINGTVLSSCSSSQRYKQNVQPLRAGLNLIQRLRPVTFDWKERQEHDLGLIAEEVAQVEPLLVTHNKTGVIEGVKYEQLAVVLINAVKEQQVLIAAQQRQLAALQKLVCRTRRRASACQPTLAAGR